MFVQHVFLFDLILILYWQVRLPSPGRKPFQSVNATDLQYFNGSLPQDWNAQVYKTGGVTRLKPHLSPKCANGASYVETHLNGHPDPNYSPPSIKKAVALKSENGYSDYHRITLHQPYEGSPHPEVMLLSNFGPQISLDFGI